MMNTNKTFMKKILCPSMMCADYGNLEREMHLLEEATSDSFHVDFMDGQYVPNFGMGLQDLEYLCGNASIPVDAHLMIENPGNYVDKFVALGVRAIYIHPDADKHPTRTLQMISDKHVQPGICINPGVAVETIMPLLSYVKFVMVMSVNPGFAGQNYIPYVDEKIFKLVSLKKNYDFHLMLDGACSPERIKRLASAGVDGFVLGTSALFGKGRPYKDIMFELRSM